MPSVTVYDPTLRDGNHACKHSLSLHDIEAYCRAADAAGVDIVEIGHGNGLGASSLQLGFARHSDRQMLECARANLKRSRLGVHAIPGFARLDDIRLAVDCGVDVIRVAAHCTEADITRKYIEFAAAHGKVVHGVLMMSHMATVKQLLEETSKQQSYGAHVIVLMDSAGNYVEREVRERYSALVDHLAIPVGFHGHNNLGMAVANSLAAVQAGATLVDGTLHGFGAGAGNTQLEVLVAVLQRYGYETSIDLFRLLELTENLQNSPIDAFPVIKASNLVSGLYGVCAGFEKHVAKAAQEFNVPTRDIWRELQRCNAVAGQEDLIIEAASRLKRGAEAAPLLQAEIA